MLSILLLAKILFAAAEAEKTNFVVLFMDDNGWGDSSVNMGVDAVHETPHMQKMADEGITFSDFHSSYSVCTASRGALLTGRLAPRTGVANNFGPTSSYGMAPGELTIADVLGAHGYESHMIGKVGGPKRSPYLYRSTNIRVKTPIAVAARHSQARALVF